MTDTDDVVRPRLLLDVREYFEMWARWRERARYYHSAPAAAGGEYIGAKGSRVCPTCEGDGRMPGHLVGLQQKYAPLPCPQCDGHKRVSGDLGAKLKKRQVDCPFCLVRDERNGTYRATGELPDGRTCHKCKGGRRIEIDLTVHPAMIKSTTHLGPYTDPDTISVLINTTVMQWREHNAHYWLARVVVEEYCRNGTQTIKAERIGVSQGWFSKNLDKAHRLMTEVIRSSGSK